MTTTTDTIDKVLAAARRELGYVAPSSGSKFGKAYGIPKGAWCAMFVSVILERAGLKRGEDFPWHAWTPNGVAWGQSRGRFRTHSPRRGDLVYFMWSSVSPRGRGNPPVCHVGFVEAVNSDGSITTIEGNTSGRAGGSEYNGGTVQRKVRRGAIVGYVSPDYAGAYSGKLGSRTIMPGDRGADVEAWQKFLNGKGADLEEDGINGELTQGATKVYQRSVGIDDDGIPGPITFGKAGIGSSVPKPSKPKPKPKPAPQRLKITGKLDRPTILALQDHYGTTEDGFISDRQVIRPGPNGRGRVVGTEGDSALIRAMQADYGTPEDGHVSTPRSSLVRAMQRAHNMPVVDGFMTAGYSSVVAEVQRRLNAGTYRKGKR